jgi:uncharacterized protein YqeY
MLISNVKKQITEAMKAGDELRLSTLKMLLAALTNAEIDKKREKLTENEELKIVKSEAKKRKDAIVLYKQGKADDKAKREEEELRILQEFLPEEMEESELVSIVNQAIKDTGASSMADMGKVMEMVMGKVKGQAGGDRVSALVKERLK